MFGARVQKFTGTGEFLTKWGSAGTGDGEFSSDGMGGIAVDDDGNVYVVDAVNHRIQKFGVPVQPRLAIEPAPGNVRISWPLPATDFVLDETATLAVAPIPWMQVPFPYQTNTTHIFITVPMPSGNKFYRLRKP